MTGTASYVYAGAAPSIFGTPSDVARGGVFRRAVGDGARGRARDHWEALAAGLPERPEIHAIAVHPEQPDVLYAGTQDGPYRSTGRGRWERVGFPDRGLAVWSILFHPRSPRTLYLGAAPAAVYRSDDGGDTWRRLPGANPVERLRASFPMRVIRLAADPMHPDDLYAAVEVGGVMRSLDGGESWSDCSSDLVKLAERPHLRSRIVTDSETEGMLDCHALCVSSAQPGTVIAALRMGLFRSADRGATWEDMEIGRSSPLTYARDIRVSPHDPTELYACLSPAARSEDGSLYRSADLGSTWQRFDRGVEANSTMMAVAVHPRDARQVYCASRRGQVFGTRDGGRTWEECPLPADVQDVYALACG